MNILDMPIRKVAFKSMIVPEMFSIFHLGEYYLIIRGEIKIGEDIVVINNIFATAVLFYFFGELVLCKYFPDCLHRKALERENDQKNIGEYQLHCVQDSNLLDRNRCCES